MEEFEDFQLVVFYQPDVDLFQFLLGKGYGPEDVDCELAAFLGLQVFLGFGFVGIQILTLSNRYLQYTLNLTNPKLRQRNLKLLKPIPQ